MAEEEPKKKINFKKIALFGLGPIVLIGIGLGVGAFLFMPTQTPVEQVEELIEKKLQQAGQLPSAEGEDEAAAEPEKVYKDTPSTDTFVTSYYTFPDNFTTNFMTLLNRLPFFPLYYNGNTKFAPIHCSDLTDTIFHIISKNIYSKIIECVGPEVITFKEILQRLLKLINKKRLLIRFVKKK